MSETQGQSNDSPLLSERGVTTISDTVVSSLASMAAGEVEGVHMGGGASRAAGGMLGNITGSESKTSGISVEIGQTEVAIDLKMGIEYNKNILQTVEEVRQRITERVESTTGLRIKELNATITDITFPEKEARRRIGPARRRSEQDESPQATTAAAPETRTTPQDEATEPADSKTTQAETVVEETPVVETAEVDTTEPEAASIPEEDSSAPEDEEVTASVESQDAPEQETIVEEAPPEEQETVVEERPPEEDEITEAHTEEQLVEESSESETTREVQTPPEPETTEARMRRRAEERARRRRRRVQEEDS
ncbi:MAG TPA: Asp23/Gls24 family envelope stress response protein [Rubrobacter sp.]|nr:Asp23/Gls24 family envelope stress response protein [Rubrobacter sp.]